MRKLPQKPKARTPRVPTLTIAIDDELRKRIDRHREVNWSEVIRLDLRRHLDRLEKRK